MTLWLPRIVRKLWFLNNPGYYVSYQTQSSHGYVVINLSKPIRDSASIDYVTLKISEYLKNDFEGTIIIISWQRIY